MTQPKQPSEENVERARRFRVHTDRKLFERTLADEFAASDAHAFDAGVEHTRKIAHVVLQAAQELAFEAGRRAGIEEAAKTALRANVCTRDSDARVVFGIVAAIESLLTPAPAERATKTTEPSR